MKVPTVTVYKDVLFKILEDHNITPDDMSARLGYTKKHLSYAFRSSGNGTAELPVSAVVAMAALMAVKQDAITAQPKVERVAKTPEIGERIPIDDITQIRRFSAESVLRQEQTLAALNKLEKTIREVGGLLHQDLFALLKEWKPKPEPLKIGGDASK